MANIFEARPFTATAEALQIHLRRFFPAAQYAMAVVPEQAKPEVWRALTRRTPFIGLSWGGLTVDPQSGRALHGRCNWALTLVTRHSEVTKRYLGDVTTPALLQMVWLACVALQGHALQAQDGTNLGSIYVAGADNAYAAGWGEEGEALATIGFSTPLPSPGDALAGGLAEFLTLAVTWDFPAAGAVSDEFERPA